MTPNFTRRNPGGLRYLLTPHDFSFGHVKRIIAAGPLGKDRGIVRRLPSEPL
jgi:hypothetical protein